MEIGIFFTQERANWRDIVRLSQIAESYNVEFVGLIDSHINYMDVYPMLTAVALETDRIRIGPMVTNPITRHPSVTASTIASIQVMSQGRAFLGYGRGDSAVKMLGLNAAKWRRYEESIGNIRAWMNGEAVEVDGAPGPVALSWTAGEARIPMSLGVFGPRAAGTAGRLADVATTECAEPGTVEWLNGMVQAAAADAGRVHVPFEVSIAMHVANDIEVARDMCRYEVDMKTNTVWQLLRRYSPESLPPSLVQGFEWLTDIDDWWSMHDWSRHGRVDEAHKQIATDDLVDRWTICGSSERCISKLRRLEKLGVSRFCAYLAGISGADLETQVRRIGEEIVPALATTEGKASSADGQLT